MKKAKQEGRKGGEGENGKLMKETRKEGRWKEEEKGRSAWAG